MTKNDILPTLKVNTPETDWKKELNNLVNSKLLIPTKDSTEYQYLFKLKDTVIRTTVNFNDDGLNNGTLRSIEIDLCDKFSYPQAKFKQNEWDWYSILAETNICDTLVFYKVYNKLYSIFGKLDSMKYYSYKVGDTSNMTYYFSDNVSSFELFRVYKYDTYAYYPPFYRGARLKIISKDYNNQFDLAQKEAFRYLKITDYFDLSFYPPKATSGFNLSNTLEKDVVSIKLKEVANYAVADDRKVRMAKGTFQIVDTFDDIIYSKDDLEITPSYLVAPFPKRGYNLSVPFAFETLTVTLGYDLNSNKLRAAILHQTNLKAKFIPTAIVFEDGTVLK